MMYDYVITKPPIETILKHSGVKGMKWKNHKYISNTNGVYKYAMGTYTKGDSDFDDSNYSEKNRIGNTDFFGFKNKDGKFVVITEDKKWVMPNGKISPELINRLNNFNKDGKLKGDEWTKAATEAVTGNKSNQNSNSKKLNDKDLDDLSNRVIRGEYKNGEERKKLLGEAYQSVQDLVNKKLRKRK